nr:DUF1566 domain-containing protein [Gilvimarinus xylanilyticus]
MVKSTPSSDFTFHGDGTATHNPSGLMWSRCAMGQNFSEGSCIGRGDYIPWGQALVAAESLDYAGYTDWRLPNAKELYSIVETSCWDPAINQSVFLNFQGQTYWTSTPHSEYPEEAWLLTFSFASLERGNKGTYNYVFTVREPN